MSGSVHFREDLSAPKYAKGPLSQRAWTLQEDILSPRLLRFAGQMMYWRCVDAQSSEDTPNFQGEEQRSIWWAEWPASRTGVRLIRAIEDGDTYSSKSSLLELWYNLINYYASRGVTYPKDRLVAISAISKMLGEKMGWNYVGGLWAHDIHNGLLWGGYANNHSRPEEYVAPSWSWASTNFSSTQKKFEYDPASRGGPFIYCFYEDWLTDGVDLVGVSISRAEIIEVSTSNLNYNPYGQITTGWLTLRAKCLSICGCRIPSCFLDCHAETADLDIYNRSLGMNLGGVLEIGMVKEECSRGTR